MMKNTFCHVPGITAAREQKLWDSGCHSWDSLLQTDFAQKRKGSVSVSSHIEQSLEQIEKDNPSYFAEQLPSSLHWRLFPDFRHSIAYVDIETTGLERSDIITTIALYDGKSIFHYVQGEKKLVILNGANFSLKRGEMVALVAPSGAGKSTLLHTAGLLERPDSGEVFLGQRACGGLSDDKRTALRRNEIGLRAQDDAVLQNLQGVRRKRRARQ